MSPTLISSIACTAWSELSRLELLLLLHLGHESRLPCHTTYTQNLDGVLGPASQTDPPQHC